jgi:hypothetical protein
MTDAVARSPVRRLHDEGRIMTTNRLALLVAVPLTLACTFALAQSGTTAAPPSTAPAQSTAPPATAPNTAAPTQTPTAQPLPSNSTPAAPSRLSTPNPPQNSAPAAPPVGLPSNPSANQGVRDPNAPTLTPNTTPNTIPNVVAPNTVQSPAIAPQNPTGAATPNVAVPTAPLPSSAINGARTLPSRSESLTALDRNRDGYISAEEFAANTQARTVVADCDTDRDGKIASYEYSACLDNTQR